MISLKKARETRRIIEKAVASPLTDQEASKVPYLFRTMNYDGELIPYLTKIEWNGVLKVAAQDLWDTEENNPDNAPNLWSDIIYKDGYRYIKENPTAADQFSLGEFGWWEDQLYESLMNGNVFTPISAPNVWRLVE